MCGIIGYIGNSPAKPILLDALGKLEYRGYDSAGIAVYDASGVKIVRTVGKVAALAAQTGEVGVGTLGIGHTRWATHGGVTEINAHPHRCGRVTIVHNGIVENHRLLRERLARLNRTPRSQTDTEIAAMLIDSLYDSDPRAAILEAAALLEGSFALVVIFDDHPDELYAIRHASPLVAVRTSHGCMIASDMTALLQYSRDYIAPPENAIVCLTRDDITLYDAQGHLITPEYLHADWDETSAQKSGYPHFMLKEIYEQPDALRRTIIPRVRDDVIDLTPEGIPDSVLSSPSRIWIVACGTAMHSGLAAKHWIERLARVPVEVDIASEFRYRDPIVDKDTLVILVSQSGETADTIAAMRLAQQRGAKTLSIVNCKGSTIARESDHVLYTHAGPEIAVASTKAFSVQLAAGYMLAARIAYARGAIDTAALRDMTQRLLTAPTITQAMLDREADVRRVAERVYLAHDMFYIGRGLDVGMAEEGSLKLKEICYLHSEAYSAGELKHGTISLIEEDVPVFVFATQPDVFPKTLSNACEIHSRHGQVIFVSPDDFHIDPADADDIIRLPCQGDWTAVFALAVALQFLAYHCALNRGLSIDQPRNLAKSVTVE